MIRMLQLIGRLVPLWLALALTVPLAPPTWMPIPGTETRF